jgi:hypothetical protein
MNSSNNEAAKPDTQDDQNTHHLRSPLNCDQR